MPTLVWLSISHGYNHGELIQVMFLSFPLDGRDYTLDGTPRPCPDSNGHYVESGFIPSAN